MDAGVCLEHLDISLENQDLQKNEPTFLIEQIARMYFFWGGGQILTTSENLKDP